MWYASHKYGWRAENKVKLYPTRIHGRVLLLRGSENRVTKLVLSTPAPSSSTTLHHLSQSTALHHITLSLLPKDYNGKRTATKLLHFLIPYNWSKHSYINFLCPNIRLIYFRIEGSLSFLRNNHQLWDVYQYIYIKLFECIEHSGIW